MDPTSASATQNDGGSAWPIQAAKKQYNPQFMYKMLLQQFRIDPTAATFDEKEMIKNFRAQLNNEKIPMEFKERITIVLEILKEHPFWNKQPVMDIRYAEAKKGAMKDFQAKDISTEPTTLPAGFSWSNFDVTNDFEVDEVCIFLNAHYIEDDDGAVRIYNDRESVRHLIMTPNFHSELHFCVRNDKNNKIMAVVTGTPKRMVVMKETVKLIEGNFLAVHKSLRGKKLAQVMIEELGRRKRLLGYKQAFFTSPDPYPTPFQSVSFLNRLLNIQKLIEVGFIQAPPPKQLEKFRMNNRLPDKKSLKVKGNMRLMEKKDASAILKIYNK